MKQNKTLINELRQELRYHQTMLRVDIRAVKAGTRKCKEIGVKMRALQNTEYCKCQNTILDKYFICNLCGLPKERK